MLKDVLVKLRKAHNYTQDDVADKVNVSRQAVSKWEKGVSVPDIYNCQELCKLYGISIEELLESDVLDKKDINPIGKYMFGYTKINDDGSIKLSKECLEKMGYNVGDMLICFGDVNQGIAFTKAKDYEDFAKAILKAKAESENNNGIN